MREIKIDKVISELTSYALKKELIDKNDMAFSTNLILTTLGLNEYTPCDITEERELCEILSDICDFAFQKGLLESNSVVYRDLFDTKIMSAFVARPSDIINKFSSLYEKSPKEATDYFYNLSIDSNYIRSDRIKKDLKWKYTSEYGDIDITVNLSKPEKDPAAIMAAKLLPQSGYPKCALCHENEGFPGSVSKAARQTLRQIPLDLAGDIWYLQYSPYVYYNEHCIVLSKEHTPMKIERKTFIRLLDFIEKFPHYFIGSNTDLPIVGGSILSHNHMQGGRYTFAMEKAPIEIPLVFKGFEDVDCGILKWPLSVIRLSSEKRERIIDLADAILRTWRDYTDADAFIFAKTDGEIHNTVTPIARKKGNGFELDITLRNNITTEQYPLGYYHPHPECHNVKKENIGLIEVMGLAVLPSRLKHEIELMKDSILCKRDFSETEELKKHRDWFLSFADSYTFTKDNIDSILRKEIGKTFVHALEDAGVYKTDAYGRKSFLRFVEKVNKNLEQSK